MFRNTFEHGYNDAVRGQQRILGSAAYIEGFDFGVRYMKRQKAIELTVLGIISAVAAICMVVWITTPAGAVIV